VHFFLCGFASLREPPFILNIVKLLPRLKVTIISTLGYWIIKLVCKSLQWEIHEAQSLDALHKAGKSLILAFWHGRIFTTAYYFGSPRVVAMTSQNRDGEYIAQVLQKFGCGVARGSSTRGSQGAVLECLRAIKKGKDLGMAIDGPRGPRYVAKPGAAYLARKSGNPVIPLNIAVEKKWVMKSWDLFEAPLPFSRAVLLAGNPIYVAENATNDEMQAAEANIQQSLDDLRIRSDSWWGK
jgi:lysophospholipid acyltransferase (LPLAT)-like uncharacterized protein